MSDQLQPSAGDRPPRLTAAGLGWLVYTMFIVYGSAIPFQFTSDRSFIVDKLRHVSPNPLIASDTGRRVSLPDVAQNVLFFLPFGVFGALVGRGSGRTAGRTAVRVTGLALCLSASAEALQLFTIDRVTSVTDVLSDATGALVGALAVGWLAAPLSAWLCGCVAIRRVDFGATFAVLAALSLVCLAAWVPFDVTIDVSTIASHVRAFEIDPWQVRAWLIEDPAQCVIAFALLAGVVAAWRRRGGMRGAVVQGAAAATVMAVAVTAGQTLVGSRVPSLAAVAGAIVGATFGAGIWSIARRFSSRWTWPVVVILAAASGQSLDAGILALAARNPHQLGAFVGGCSTDMFIVTWRAINRMLAFAPVGFALAVIVPQRQAVVLAVALALIGGMIVETIRIHVAGCRIDFVTVTAGACGAWLGAWTGSVGLRRWADGLEAFARP